MSTEKFDKQIAELKEAGCYRQLPSLRHEGKYVEMDGRRFLNLSSNDYLGLASDPNLRERFLSSMGKELLMSSSSSRLLTGNFGVYERLEALLARRYGCRSALLFNSGYHANIGILPAVADKRTLIVADKLVHASLIDGIQLAGATYKRYRHNDYEQLIQILEQEGAKFDTRIIVTESVFSMDGDQADLKRLVAIKKSFPDTLLYVDEAHAVGVFGQLGLGLAEELGVVGDIDFLVATFGKALGSVGAYVICNESIKNYLINKMRPLIFSTALPPVNVGWSLFLFDMLPEFKERSERLLSVSRWFREQLVGGGAETPSQSHIIPFIVGGNRETLQLSDKLKEGGFLALPVRPPTVPQGSARIRFSLTSDIDTEELKSLITLLP